MKNPLSNISVTITHLKIIGAGAVALILATIAVTTYFVKQADFDVYVQQVAAEQTAQNTKNIRADLMMEIRFLQAQRRQAKADGNQSEVDRLTDEIAGLKLELKGLK